MTSKPVIAVMTILCFMQTFGLSSRLCKKDGLIVPCQATTTAATKATNMITVNTHNSYSTVMAEVNTDENVKSSAGNMKLSVVFIISVTFITVKLLII